MMNRLCTSQLWQYLLTAEAREFHTHDDATSVVRALVGDHRHGPVRAAAGVRVVGCRAAAIALIIWATWC